MPPTSSATPAASRAPSRPAASRDLLLEKLQFLAAQKSVRAGVVALALAFFALCAGAAARVDTPTPDEFVYVPAGVYHLKTGDLSFDPTNPPLLKMIMALPPAAMGAKIDSDPARRDNRTGWAPWIFGTSFLAENRERYLDFYFASRLVIVALGVLLGVAVYLRAFALFSPAAALVAVLLYATMPPLLAHSAVATLDLGVTALLFATLVAASRFARTRDWRWAAATGALFGFAFATKGTAALYAPLLPLAVAVEWRDWRGASLQRFVAGGAVMLAGAWLAILVSYGFQGFPLPAPLVEGVKFQLAQSSAGEFPAFLFGSWSQTGWWYYYLVALLLKTPIATLVLLAVGIAALALSSRQRRASEPFWNRERSSAAWLLAPPLLLVYLLSFHYAKDYGIRYLLPAFPFFVLIAARGAELLLRSGRGAQALLALLLVWQTAATAISAPRHLAWFNGIAGGPDRARHMLLDSNLDWGQDLGRFADWWKARGGGKACLGYFGHVDPKLYGLDYGFPPNTPSPGLCAISANFLGGYPYAITYAGERIIGVKAKSWSWYDGLEPAARIGDSIYVFDVSEADAARLRAGARQP